MAAQGGLLATLVAQRSTGSTGGTTSTTSKEMALPILMFLVAKLVAYTLLGGLLGWLGSFFTLSLSLQAGLMAVVAVFMLGSGLALLDVHPFFRRFLITPPRFLLRLVRSQSKSREFFAPALLGALTIVVPCGTTQAMMALSIASGNPVSGALILATFVLGTSPLFFGVGYGVSRVGGALGERFRRAVAVAVVGIAVWNLNTAAVLTGSRFTLQALATSADCVIYSNCGATTGMVAGATSSEATITITKSGYVVDKPVLKAGSTATIRVVNEDGAGCQQALVIPRLGVQAVVPVGQNKTLVVKVPEAPGTLPFSCSMGMFGGEFQISS